MTISTTTYDDFLRSKIAAAPETGFQVDQSELSPILKPHERDAVIWALRGGRRALFTRIREILLRILSVGL